MWRFGDIVVGPLDLKGGFFTYGNRIALATIFADVSLTDYQKMKAAHRELYGYSCRWLPVRARTRRLDSIVEAMLYWIERERIAFDYTPTVEEQTAGIEQFNAEVGCFATIKALAKAYSKDPDEVLMWDYAKVFEILRTDLAEAKYNRRYSAVLQRKAKNNGHTKRKR